MTDRGRKKPNNGVGSLFIYTIAGLALLVVFFLATIKESVEVQKNDSTAIVKLESIPEETILMTEPPRIWSRKPGRRYVWIDVAIDDVTIGRVTVELYMDIVPKTAENFRGLVTGDNAAGISYKKSKCHRILKGFIVQCGDYEYGKGYGGNSIYGGTFEDEKAGLSLEHSKRYILQMANYGPDTNKSQFCFMLAASPGLNGHHVVFGEVIDGFFVIDKMEEAGVNTDNDTLEHTVVLVDGGEIFD